MLERFVNGPEVFLFQPTGSGKFETLGSGTSDSKVNKGSDQLKQSLSSRDKAVRQIKYYLS